MPGRSKKQQYDPNHEYEVLNSDINLSGHGEDSIVQKMLSDDFVTAKDTEAGAIAIQLAQLITGMKMTSEQINKVMNRMERIESAQRAWEEDRQKFLDNVNSRSESLLATTQTQKDKYMAEWMQAAQEAKIQATAEATVGKIKFDTQLEREPKVTIMSPGIPETHRHGDQMEIVMAPEVIAIKHRKWILPPGVAVEVPQTVAIRYEEIKKSRDILRQRQELMRNGANEQSVVANGWNKINRDNNIGGEVMPLA